MMQLISGLSLLSCVLLMWLILSVRPLLRDLTLIYSWRWAVVATVVLTLSTSFNSGFLPIAAGWRSASQLWAVVMLLTPPVSTLGARKPGAGAWQLFVVTPLIIVLLWPGLSQLVSSRGLEPLDLGLPAMAGIFLVLIMSAGTSLGTAMTLPYSIYVVGMCCAILPSTGWLQLDSQLQLLCPPLLVLGTWLSKSTIAIRSHAIKSANTTSEAIDQTWQLFQELYGLVWARRVQDRVNQFAARERWTTMLTLDGFRDASGKSVPDTELQQPRDAFRWVLGRFAEEQWIQSRLFRLG